MKKASFFIVVLLIFVITVFAEENSFIASKTSKIFHKLSCRYANNLTSENANFYTSYEDAELSGLRPCLVCNPQPTVIIEDPNTVDPYDPKNDPNRIWVDPSPTPAILFPINGVVLQSEYCRKKFNPATDIGSRIIDDTSVLKIYSEIKQRYGLCESCFSASSNPIQWFPSNSLTPIWSNPYVIADPLNIPDPNTWDYGYIVSYVPKDESSVLVFSNDKQYCHSNPNCLRVKAVPVRMVNMRSGMVSGNDAYFHPALGVLEWVITPFEIGDYTAVMNSDVGQMQLQAITVRSQNIPSLAEFSDTWLKGNFNMYKYSEWTKNIGMHQRLMENSIGGDNRIEWQFVDGKWIPTVNGFVSQSTTTRITDHTTFSRETIKSDIKIAPYEWATKKVVITEVTTTTTEGLKEYTEDKDVLDKIAYLNYAPFADAVKTAAVSLEEDRQMQAQSEIDFYNSIGVPPEPVKVEEPSMEDAFASILSLVNSPISTALGNNLINESVQNTIQSYENQLDAYNQYKLSYAEWEKIKQQIIDDHESNLIDMEMRDHMLQDRYAEMHAGMDSQHFLETFSYALIEIYANYLNSLTEEDKADLIRIRRKIIDGELIFDLKSSAEIEQIIQNIDPDSNEVDPNTL